MRQSYQNTVKAILRSMREDPSTVDMFAHDLRDACMGPAGDTYLAQQARETAAKRFATLPADLQTTVRQTLDQHKHAPALAHTSPAGFSGMRLDD